MICEMSGKDTNLFLTEVEGCELNVCRPCGKFGKVIKAIRPPVREKKPKKEEKIELVRKEIIMIITPKYSNIIKQKRERMNMKQQDLAKMIAEKESVINNLESGKLEPSIRLARKLEKFLRVKIVEQHEEGKERKYNTKTGPLTIGDLISIKKN